VTAGAGAQQGPLPLIVSDETWSGEVRLGGTIIISAGAVVTLAPGARVVLGPGARVLVRGRLLAAGTPEARVRVEAAGEGWNDIILAENASADLRWTDITGSAGDSLSLRHGAGASLEDCRLSAGGRFALNHRSTGALTLARCSLEGGTIGLSAVECGPVRLSDCSLRGQGETALELGCAADLERVAVEDCPGLALRVVGGAARASELRLSAREGAKAIGEGALEWSGGSCAALETGLGVEGGRARVSGVSFTGGARGVRVEAGGLEAEDCSFEGQSKAAVWCAEGGSLALSRCSLAGAPSGVSSRGPASLSDCRLTGHAEAGVDLAGAGHSLRDVTLSDCGVAVSLAGEARLERVAAAGSRHAAAAAAGSSLSWTEGTASGGEAALVGEGARVELSGLSVEGGRCGALARGGAWTLTRCAFRGQQDAALELSRGEHSLREVTAAGCGEALVVAGGSCRGERLDLSAARTVLWAREGADALLESSALRGARLGARVEGAALSARGCRWESQTEAGLRADAAARIALSGCAFGGAPAGVEARGSFSAEDCAFNGHQGTALELSGAARLARARVEGCGLGLRVVAGVTSAAALILSARDGAVVVGEGRLEWDGGECAADGVGLRLEGGRARLRKTRFSGGARGASVESGALEAEDAVWEDQKRAAVWCAPGGAVRLSRCSFSGAANGVSSAGPAEIRDCRFQGHADAGAELRGPGHALAATELSACGVAVTLDGSARLDGVRASGERHGLTLAPGSALAWSGGAASGGEAAVVSDEARAELSGLSVEGGRCGALVRGGSWRVSDCALSGQDAGLELAGGEHEVSGGRLSGAAAALVVSAGSCRAVGVEACGRDAGAVVRAGALLDWRGGRCEGRHALVVSGTARVDGLEAERARQGLRVEGGALSARGVVLRGCAECGVLLDGGGFAELSGLLVEGAPVAVAAREGHLHLLEDARLDGCDAAVVVEPTATVCLAAAPRRAPRAASARRRLLERVLATRRSALWRPLYRLAYASAAAWLPLRLRACRGVRAAGLHRGWSGPDWEPGVSDLDALVVAEGLSGAAGSLWLRRFWRRYGGWKAALPFLGEVLVAERAEAAAFVRAGGARSSALAAALPGPWPAPDGAGWDGRALERVHAYTRLLQCCFAEDELWARNARQAAKGLLDALRYAQPGEAVSRSEAARTLARGGAARALEVLQGPAPGDPALAIGRAAAQALAALDRAADGVAPVPARPADAAPTGDAAVESLRQCFGPGTLGVLSDDLYRSFVVLDERAAETEELALSLAQAARRHALRPGTLPVPVTPRVWGALARVPYLEDPTRGLGFDPSGGPLARRAAGRLLPGSSQAAWGVCRERQAVSEGDLRASARAAAANLALTWRWLGCASSGADPRAAFHYLLSRSLGLRLLLERGAAPGFFGLDALLERAAAEFPELARPLQRLEPLDEGASLERAFFANYALVDSQVRRALAAAGLDGEAR
jgi:hypothetical protein